MEKKKVRATRTNGRKDSNGVFKAGHNDRSFNLENAEHVDADRSKLNVYWDYLQGYNLADENGVRQERKYLFDEVEYLYYHKQFGDSIDAQNERHEKSRHAERIRNVRLTGKNSSLSPGQKNFSKNILNRLIDLLSKKSKEITVVISQKLLSPAIKQKNEKEIASVTRSSIKMRLAEMKEKADQKNDDHNQKKQSEREVR